ncbi:hypothetical protein [Nocardia cyriacigeorgica]|uniref:hypothetical protein n=1 Tax=Nocardia cyriacigeorgica TaxID=135487 RepID=UPI0024546EE6|nr:hypothetical protein [Nocardia cyriacigeorgica]
MTLARVGMFLCEIGMVPEPKLREILDDLAADADDDVDHYAAACALETFGVAVRVHADDAEDLRQGYASLLARAVEVAGGAVTISDVRLVEGDDDIEESSLDRLEFERNGVLVSIDAEHYSDHYYDHAAACEAIASTAADDDPRAWRVIGFDRTPGRGYDSIMALATAEQARALQEQLGVTVS